MRLRTQTLILRSRAPARLLRMRSVFVAAILWTLSHITSATRPIALRSIKSRIARA